MSTSRPRSSFRVRLPAPSFYDSALWQKTRSIKLSRNPWCEVCEKLGIKEAARAVDHIIAMAKGGHPTDLRNLRSMCFSHHNSKTAREDMRNRRTSETVYVGPDGFPIEFENKGVLLVIADTEEERCAVLRAAIRGEL